MVNNNLPIHFSIRQIDKLTLTYRCSLNRDTSHRNKQSNTLCDLLVAEDPVAFLSQYQVIAHQSSERGLSIDARGIRVIDCWCRWQHTDTEVCCEAAIMMSNQTTMDLLEMEVCYFFINDFLQELSIMRDEMQEDMKMLVYV